MISDDDNLNYVKRTCMLDDALIKGQDKAEWDGMGRTGRLPDDEYDWISERTKHTRQRHR